MHVITLGVAMSLTPIEHPGREPRTREERQVGTPQRRHVGLRRLPLPHVHLPHPMGSH